MICTLTGRLIFCLALAGVALPSVGRADDDPPPPLPPHLAIDVIELAAKTPPIEVEGPAAGKAPAADVPVADDTVTEDPVTIAAPPRELTPELLRLREKVRRTLVMYYPKRLNSRDHNPWEMMHTIIGWGVHAEIDRERPGGDPINAVSWLAINGRCAGHELLTLERGRLAAKKGPYVQGHYAQLLAILAQSRVMPEYPLYVGGKSFIIGDLIESEMKGCAPDMELTFKLISLSHYLDSDTEWQSDNGQTWSIPRLIDEELKAPIRGAACGGTHRLMGLSYAVQKRKQQGKPVDGQYWRAEKYISDYHKYAFSLQNSDGSFSTAWFTRREAKNDVERRLQTSGHILEWLAYSVPDEMLDSPQMTRAVSYLSGILLAEPSRQWSIGPLGHAIHALALYDQRMFGSPYNIRPSRLLDQPEVANESHRRKVPSEERVAVRPEPRTDAQPEPKIEPIDAERQPGPAASDDSPVTSELHLRAPLLRAPGQLEELDGTKLR